MQDELFSVATNFSQIGAQPLVCAECGGTVNSFEEHECGPGFSKESDDSCPKCGLTPLEDQPGFCEACMEVI